jgi:tetratricopeptide (TPR) repeat protein
MMSTVQISTARRVCGRLARLLLATALAFAFAAPPVAHSADLTRAQALAALANPEAKSRFEAIVRLADVGSMADANTLVKRLHDDDGRVRQVAAAALWQIWGRSGNPTIDALYQRGLKQMDASDLAGALVTFNRIVRQQPGFAEGWNKRATVLYLTGEYAQSLKDCEQVLKRNPNHFGALSGMGQIYMRLGDLPRAIQALERALALHPSQDNTADTIEILKAKLQQQRDKTI